MTREREGVAVPRLHPGSACFGLWLAEMQIGDMISADKLRHNVDVYLNEVLRSVHPTPECLEAARQAMECCRVFVSALEVNPSLEMTQKTRGKQKAAMSAIEDLRLLVEASPRHREPRLRGALVEQLSR